MSTDFGKRLKEARKHANITQKELAPLVGMSQSNLSELETVAHESGKTVQLAYVCGVNPYWLATGEGEMLGGVGPAPPLRVPTLNEHIAALGRAVSELAPTSRTELANLLQAWVHAAGRIEYETLIAECLTSAHLPADLPVARTNAGLEKPSDFKKSHPPKPRASRRAHGANR